MQHLPEVLRCIVSRYTGRSIKVQKPYKQFKMHVGSMDWPHSIEFLFEHLAS